MNDNDNGMELLDADYENLMRCIDNYDNANDGDVEKGGDKPLTDAQIQIGLTLTDLICCLTSVPACKLRQWKRLWSSVHGQAGTLSGSMLDAMEVAKFGRQCNNAIADWMRACLSNFSHHPDELSEDEA